MSSAVILTWMEISFVFITVVFCFGSLVRAVTLYRKVPKSSGPGEQLLELWGGVARKVGASLDWRQLNNRLENASGKQFVCFCFV